MRSGSVLGRLEVWRVSWIVRLLQIRARRARRGLGGALLVLKGTGVIVVVVVERWEVIPRYHSFAFVPRWYAAASLVEAAIAAAVMYLWSVVHKTRILEHKMMDSHYRRSLLTR